MKKRIMFVVAFVLIIASLFCGCKKSASDDIVTDSNAALLSTELGEGKNTFTFTVVDASGNKDVFDISTDKKIVGDALKEHNLISGQEGEFGLYVKTVNGKTYDYNKDGKYWAFYVDGEYASAGVDKTEIKSGCAYMFKAE